jgi:hypothetical protein
MNFVPQPSLAHEAGVLQHCGGPVAGQCVSFAGNVIEIQGVSQLMARYTGCGVLAINRARPAFRANSLTMFPFFCVQRGDNKVSDHSRGSRVADAEEPILTCFLRGW